LRGESIRPETFEKVCKELDLDWEAIAQAEADLTPDALDLLVQRVRQQVYADVQTRCGTMRVLDMEQPITIDSIYTKVNILERISRNQRRTIVELQEGGDLNDFDRFTLGPVRLERIPGLEAVQHCDKLLILGKPGAGKTTFLKWLAIQCNEGQLHPHRVPIFIALKEFAETPASLQGFICSRFNSCGIENADRVTETLLQAGRSLVLLDGLDEVRDVDRDRVLREIRNASIQFDASQFVMTCRIAAQEYTFEQFTEVEIADFDQEQIADFSHKWFHFKDPVKAAAFTEELRTHKPLEELATNPLLLTLLCFVFEERAGFPINRADLYKEGLDILLKKWDVKRKIERDEAYKWLSPKRKEDLLSQIALTTFESGNYFFKQKEAEHLIEAYIQHLPDVQADPEALRLDSEVVLKSIEAQHGLLVERSRFIYSFSHLTFHEYFTARELVTRERDELPQVLLPHLSDKRWREVFLLTVEMLENADSFLRLIKSHIDQMLATDPKLQQFLTRVEQKSGSVNSPCEPAAIRAFYFVLAIDLDRELDRDGEADRFIAIDLDLAIDLPASLAHELAGALAINLNHDDFNRVLDRVLGSALDLPLDLALVRAFDFVRTFDLVRVVAFDLDLAFELSGERAIDLGSALSIARELDRELDRERAITIDRNHALSIARALELACIIARELDLVPVLTQSLQDLKDQLLNIDNDRGEFWQWWQISGLAWADQLRAMMIEHRNIGHDWQFSDVQKTRLQQYYDANKLLVDCLNSHCSVSQAVRDEIEDSLLLPVTD
jgi:predicted NACHT family NTPase